MPTLEELENSANPFKLVGRPSLDINPFAGVAEGGSLLDVGAELNAPTQARGHQVRRQLSMEDASTLDLLDASLNENSAVNAWQYLNKMAFKNSPLNIPESGFNRDEYLGDTLGVDKEEIKYYDGFNSKIGIDKQRVALADRAYGRELFAANPVHGGFTFLGSQVAEPFNHLLFARAAQVGAKGVQAVKAVSKAEKLTKLERAKAALNGGVSALTSGTDRSNAARLALEAFSAEVGIELVLQLNQEERTMREGAVNITASTLFGAFIGAGARPIANLIGDMENKVIQTAIDISSLEGKEVGPTSAREVVQEALDRDSSVGAMVTETDGKKLGPRKDAGKGFKAVADTKLSKFITPGMHGLLSKSPAMRAGFAELENIGVNRAISEADDAGSFGSSPVGAKARQAIKEQGLTKVYRNDTKKIMRDYRASGGATMNEWDIYDLGAMAMRRGGRSEGLVHPKTKQALNPQEAKAAEKLAEAISSNILRPLLKDASAEDVKLIQDWDITPEFAESYFPRDYNRQLIKEKPKEWEDALSGAATRDFNDMPEFLSKQIKAVEGKLKEVSDDLKLRGKLQKELDGLESQKSFFSSRSNLKEYITEYAKDARGSVLHTTSPIAAGRFSVKSRGVLRERTLKATDKEIELFLSNDLDSIIPRLIRTMTGEIEVKRSFGTTNFDEYRADTLDPDFEKIVDKVNKEFNDRIKEADSQEERVALETQLAKENADLINDHKDASDTLEAMWNLARGTFRNGQLDPDGVLKRVTFAGRQMAMMAFLANFVVGSLVDIAMPSFVHGVSATIGRGPLSVLGKRLASSEFRESLRIARIDYEDAGIATNYISNDRMVQLAMSEDTVSGQKTYMEKIINKMAGRFGFITGGNFWNDNAQAATGIITSRRLSRLRNIDLISIKKKDREWLSRIGLGSEDLHLFKNMWETHGRPDIEVPTFNFNKWEDQKMADKVKGALFNDNRAIILNRGDAEVPIAMNTDFGKIYGQFATHAALSHNRILMSSLERADKEVMIGLTNMVLWGAMSQYIKDLQAGREISDDYRVHLINGFNASSILAVGMMTNNNLLEKMGVGLSNLTGDEDYQRRVQAGKPSLTPEPALGGYTGALLDTMQGVGDLILTGKTSKGNMQSAANATMYLNIPPLKWFAHQIVEHLNEDFGEE